MRLPPVPASPARCRAAAPACQGPEPAARRRCGNGRALLLASAGAIALLLPGGPASQANAPLSTHSPAAAGLAAARLVDRGTTPVSRNVKHTVQWSVATLDHAGMPFVIVDKPAAHLYVFDAQARLVAHTPVLLGSAIGDHTVPGIGDKAIADVLPEERTTPAGRFQGRVGDNLAGEEVVWVDYDAAVSMHRVRDTRASEQRLERLASATVEDNRISYGCINVPVAFFEAHILPMFVSQAAAIYVLPDHGPLEQVFGMAR